MLKPSMKHSHLGSQVVPLSVPLTIGISTRAVVPMTAWNDVPGTNWSKDYSRTQERPLTADLDRTSLTFERKGKAIIAVRSMHRMEIWGAKVSRHISSIWEPALADVLNCSISIIYNDWPDNGCHTDVK